VVVGDFELLSLHCNMLGDHGIVEEDDSDSELDEDIKISDINDVFDAILRLCPRLVWLVLNENHEPDSEGRDYCSRPDMAISYYLKISFAKLSKILEPHEWGRLMHCSAICRPMEMLRRSDSSWPIWILVDPSGKHACRSISPGLHCDTSLSHPHLFVSPTFPVNETFPPSEVLHLLIQTQFELEMITAANKILLITL
jgi:hypothetical protein